MQQLQHSQTRRDFTLLHELENLVSERWAEKSLTETARLEKFIDEITGKGRLCKLVDQVLSNRTLLETVAARSFYHPTGVSKIVLTSLGPTMPEVRLHYWPKLTSRSGGEFSIHNHRWSFGSRVLVGSLAHELFEENNVGVSHFGVMFSSVNGKKEYDEVGIGKKKLCLVEYVKLEAGDQYTLEGNRLHRLTNQGEFAAATLFIRAPYQSSSTLVLHEDGSAIKGGHYPPRVSPQVVADLLVSIFNGAQKRAN